MILLSCSILLSAGYSGCAPAGIGKIQQRSVNRGNKASEAKNANAQLSHKAGHEAVKTNSPNRYPASGHAPIVSGKMAGSAPPRSTVTIGSWNLENFGKSKSDASIDFIARTVNSLDIITIQEVVAGYGGAQAVARLANALNKQGAKWDYRVSDPTSGQNSYKRERYAFLWKTSRVSLIGRPWLERQFTQQINREPFFATFNFNGKQFTVVSFHAITKKMQPETEIKYFKFLPAEYPNDNLIFCGDFNCPQTHTVFNPLKRMGYKPIMVGQKTTLKQTAVDGAYLVSEFDHMFYHNTRINYIGSGVIQFYKAFPSLKTARKISDHIPIWFQFSVN